MFFNINDLVKYNLVELNHVSFDSKSTTSNGISKVDVKVKISTELNDWFNRNEIDYRLRDTNDLIIKFNPNTFEPDLSELFTTVGIEIIKNSDAVLFKLKWLH